VDGLSRHVAPVCDDIAVHQVEVEALDVDAELLQVVCERDGRQREVVAPVIHRPM